MRPTSRLFLLAHAASCADCRAPMTFLNGRYVHLTTSLIGGGVRPRPTFVYCPRSGQEGRPA